MQSQKRRFGITLSNTSINMHYLKKKQKRKGKDTNLRIVIAFKGGTEQLQQNINSG